MACFFGNISLVNAHTQAKSYSDMCFDFWMCLDIVNKGFEEVIQVRVWLIFRQLNDKFHNFCIIDKLNAELLSFLNQKLKIVWFVSHHLISNVPSMYFCVCPDIAQNWICVLSSRLLYMMNVRNYMRAKSSRIVTRE